MTDEKQFNLPQGSVFVSHSPWSIEVQLLFADFINGKPYVAKPLEFEPMEEGGTARPTHSMFPQQAQELFNKLYAIGYRPTDGTGNTGHVEALKYHLEDMRKLVFDKEK